MCLQTYERMEGEREGKHLAAAGTSDPTTLLYLVYDSLELVAYPCELSGGYPPIIFYNQL